MESKNFKKKCISFKNNAKEFGYELKLTHVQELLAKYEGFNNRHAILKKEKSKSKKEEWVYYSIYVSKGRDEGYTSYLRHNKKIEILNGLIDEDEVIRIAESLDLLIDDEDYRFIQSVEEIDYEEWEFGTNSKNKIECFHCKQFYPKDFIKNNSVDRKEVVCKNCDKKEVKIYISTDDGEFEYFESYIDNDYLIWSLEYNPSLIHGMIEGNYGPDCHTDCLLYDNNTKNTEIVHGCINSINEAKEIKGDEKIGFSISIEEESCKRWIRNNKQLLRRFAYDV